jgi:uncharacterized protein YcbK (DUF882 family)
MSMSDGLRRRDFLRAGGSVVGAGLISGIACPALADIGFAGARSLSFLNLHTGERLKAEFWNSGAYVKDALTAVNHVLRDHRNGEVHTIEPKLLDLLSLLQRTVESKSEIQVISGYRSPASNAKMHARSRGVASKSLHMQGKAIDIRVGDVALSTLHKAALTLKVGGVGYYPGPDFIHVDVGRVRRW